MLQKEGPGTGGLVMPGKEEGGGADRRLDHGHSLLNLSTPSRSPSLWDKKKTEGLGEGVYAHPPLLSIGNPWQE
jgi:hypothetical protein